MGIHGQTLKNYRKQGPSPADELARKGIQPPDAELPGGGVTDLDESPAGRVLHQMLINGSPATGEPPK